MTRCHIVPVAEITSPARAHAIRAKLLGGPVAAPPIRVPREKKIETPRDVVKRIVSWCAKRHRVRPSDVFGMSMTAGAMKSRRLAICLVKRHPYFRKSGVVRIGQLFGMDHTSIIHAIHGTAAQKYLGRKNGAKFSAETFACVIRDRLSGFSWDDLHEKYGEMSSSSLAATTFGIANGSTSKRARYILQDLGMTAPELREKLLKVGTERLNAKRGSRAR